MRISAGLLLFLIARCLSAQANCPTPDHNAPIPLALVSSPLIRVRPALSQSALTVPTGIESPHGIALDVAERLAFVAGEENHKFAVVDLTTIEGTGDTLSRRRP